MRRIASRVRTTSDSTGVPGDREEADQVLGRRQRGHVLDPQVVGPAGALAAAGRTVRCSLAALCHGIGSRKVVDEKKTAGGRPAVLDRCALWGYALASPSAERCENAK
jgi:hypothetical protein